MRATTPSTGHGFRNNEVRLQLHTLAYNLGNFLRSLAVPEAVKHWSLTTLREKLIKIGTKVVRHGRHITFQMAALAIPRPLFVEILRLVDGLRLAPLPPWRALIQKHPDCSTGPVCAARAGVRSHSTKKPPARLLIAESGRRRREIAIETARSGPDLMSTAVIATLPVTASGHLGNPGLRDMEKNPGGQPEQEGYHSHDATRRPPTLADLGITKDQSVRMQCAELVPEDDTGSHDVTPTLLADLGISKM